MPNIKLSGNRLKRLLFWVSGTVVVYALLGFFLVPWLGQRQLSAILEERLELQTSVQSLRFNPFTFVAEIDALEISETDNSQLLSLGHLRVNFQPGALVTLRLRFAEIDIGDLDVYFSRYSDTENTLSQFSDRWASSAAISEPTVAEEDSDGIGLEIAAVALGNITLHLRDELPSTPFTTAVTIANASVENISTLPDESGNQSIAINLEQGAVLQVNGDFSITPLVFEGDLALSDFDITVLSRYLADSLPFSLEDGGLSLSFDYDIDLSQPEIRIELANVDTSLTNFQAMGVGADSPFLAMPLLSLSDGSISLPQNQVTFATLLLEEASLSAVRMTDGVLDLQAMLEQFASPSQPSDPTTASSEPENNTPWQLRLNDLQVNGFDVNFEDNALLEPFQVTAELDLAITGLTNQEGASMPFSSELSLSSGGALEMLGEMQILPELELATSVNLDDLALSGIQPYVNEFAMIEIGSGAVGLEAQVVIANDDPLAVDGNLSLTDLQVTDLQLNESMLAVERMNIDNFSYSQSDNAATISEILLQAPFARVLVNEDSSTNISRSLRQQADTGAPVESPDAEPETAQPLALTVGRVTVENASSNFTDRNLPIVFDTDIQNLSGVADGFATNSTQPMELNLEGQVDEFGLVQIDSRLNPFDLFAGSEINLSFRNLDMPAMTPYIIKFAGREIATGNLDVDLDYAITAGQLEANNNVVVRNLQLGERVEHPEAMDMPLDLAVALLKDSNDVIDLAVPVSGDVTSPEFSVGPAIRQAFANVLVNLVTAPFSLLGNLIGGAGEDINTVQFQPGRTDIAAPEQQTLQQLCEALLQRPQLVLQIPPVHAEPDILALQTLLVDEQIDLQLQQRSPEADLTEFRRGVLEQFYEQANLQPALIELQAQHSVAAEVPEAADPAVVPAPILDVPAYNASLREQLIMAQQISTEQIQQLADERADAVFRYLVTSCSISPLQLQVADSVDAELNTDGWLVMEFDLDTAR